MSSTTQARPVRRSARASLTALVLGAALAGCGSDEQGAGGEGTTYRVGAPIVQSGPGAFAGEPVAHGIELAVQEINDSGFLGDGSTIELEVIDTAGDPAKAIAGFKQLEADRVAGILCCTLGGEAGALAPVLATGDVPAVVTVSILDSLADPPHLFRPFEVPSAAGGTYDEFLDAVLGGSDLERAVMVVNNDNDAMVQDAAVYAAGLERNDVDLRDTVQVATAETSFTSVATQVVADDPDVVVASTIGSSTAGLARALRERGWDGPIVSNVGADSAAAYDASGGAMAGTIFPTPYHASIARNEMAADFAEAYEAAHGSAPDMFAAQGYTAMWLLAAGIRDAGSDDPADVGAALADIAEQDSVYGTIAYADGQAEVQEPAHHLVWGEDGTVSEWSP
ncbi:ABC transporter substrate-binding protein [Nocardioides hwasunensis]|uniref:ABC transporter substrate-binding protein n=1 Tax=Nocardioides hwasunensis TaxID=397258 RepID=A0ABR8MKM5_9ACTN|nr:ABC transporter substrate-binding protein [Nocardioides hwasunensis]MBD3915621.1 ABC transporter substrate-binding protein [Nocardioides hwasunensis]